MEHLAYDAEMSRSSAPLVRVAAFAHRWLGAGLSILVLMWFASGFVMMYHDFPHMHVVDRLRRAPTLDPATVALSPQAAFARLGPGNEDPAFALITTFDGRPIYVGSGGAPIYADDGALLESVDAGMIDRAAAAWSGQPLEHAVKQSIDEPDQWTLEGDLRRIRPLYKYEWPDGQHVYVNGATAEVVQYTTSASRFWSYLGPIPHWLYFTRFREQDSIWLPTIMWGSILTTVAAIVGIVLAGWVYSPRQRYRRAGGPAALPYHGWKRWHAILGLTVGVTTATWAFSGWLSMGPFPWMQRLDEWVRPEEPGQLTDIGPVLKRMSDALRGQRLPFSAYDARPPQVAMASAPGFDVKELEFTSFQGAPMYLAYDGTGRTRIIPVDGEPRASFDASELISLIRQNVGKDLAGIHLLDAYDAYYVDRRGEKPLPVIRVMLADARQSRYYIDPATAAIVDSHDRGEWMTRWFYHGLHSLDFPWLYNHRPLWDIVVITLLLCGTALCMTSLVLTWRLLGRHLARVLQRRRPAPRALDELGVARPRP